MLKRVLIANRGEVAVRILRECKDMSIGTVAIFSEADREALHVMTADRAVCVGAAASSESYLNQANIVQAALATGCDAIHPGFGFLSENAEFAELCEKNGLIFIGPSPSAIRKLGDKAQAKRVMREAGVPVVPGSDGPVTNIKTARKIADSVGYPVLIKASSGGGGRGMRRCDRKEDLERAFGEAAAEAASCFGNSEVYIEKLILNPRHVEVQILADSFGKILQLGERNCSIQRRNQKMLEEAPDFSLRPEMREAMGKAAVLAARAADYHNAGTVEFIVSGEDFYFIEMNTRLQVEHPVTELVTGVNIVREQLRIAAGLPLEYEQEEIVMKGHAIECRINAEDLFQNFAPSPGHVDFLHLPGGHGVRVESALYSGCDISPFYDSMAAKIIAHGSTRLEAIRRMRRALEETIIQGVPTTLPLQHLILFNQEFLRGNYDTGFMDRNLKELIVLYEAAGGKG